MNADATIPAPGDIIEIPTRIKFRVDKILYCREIIPSENVIDGLQGYRLDGKKIKVTLLGEVVAP